MNHIENLLDFLLYFSGPVPYGIVFLILLSCGLGFPVPEDITLFVAGLLCYYGAADPVLMILVAFVGVLLGDSIIYGLGYRYGRKLTNQWVFKKLLPAHRLHLVQEKLHKKGNRLIFAARFMPGLRAPIYFSAGTLHFPLKFFLLYDGMAALISVPSIIYAVFYFGAEVDYVIRMIKKIEHGIVFLILSIVLVLIVKWYFTGRKSKENGS